MTRTRTHRLVAVAAAAALSITPLAVSMSAQSASAGTVASAAASDTPDRLGIPRALWNALDDAGRTRIEGLATHLPDGAALRGNDAKYTSVVHDAMMRHLSRVINPGDYECGPTALDAYVDELIGELELIDILIVALIYPNALNYPAYDALFDATQGDPTYALTKSTRSELTTAFRSAQNFWRSPTVDVDDIQLLAMHGDMMSDAERVRAMMLYFGDTTEDWADEDVPFLVDYIANDFPRGADNPLWTLNAYAFTAEGDPDPDAAGLPDKIVFGDGIIGALAAAGLRDVGPQAVLAHEFGHHVQFEIGQPMGGSPEGTRRSELEADYLATYFVTHKRGLARNASRVIDAIESFHTVGDCSFDNDGHHGTPNQRRAAATFGADLAKAAQKQGHIYSAERVVAEFAKVLPVVLAPDA